MGGSREGSSKDLLRTFCVIAFVLSAPDDLVSSTLHACMAFRVFLSPRSVICAHDQAILCPPIRMQQSRGRPSTDCKRAVEKPYSESLPLALAR
jgi:hypothetical protein